MVLTSLIALKSTVLGEKGTHVLLYTLYLY